MRVVAVCLVLMMIPLASAWEDPEGDHEVGARIATVEGEHHEQWAAAESTGWYPMVDLLNAEITETQDNIQFTVDVSSLDHQGTEPREYFSYIVWFRFDLRGQDMVARMEFYAEEEYRDFSYFMLGVYNPDSYWGFDYTSGWSLDIEGDSLSVDMPKRYFRDQNLVPLRQGDVLKDIRVWSTSSDFGRGGIMPFMASTCPGVSGTSVSLRQCPLAARDFLGDGGALGSFEVELAPEGVGHLMMRSDRPWRASNGLATTYLFEVEVHNFDDESDEVLLQAVDVPDQWEILHPARIEFSEAGSTVVPIAVTVPFAHAHGETNFMEIQAQSTKNNAVSTSTWLGVIFADPPQPAGHHDKLYLHARDTSTYSGWMNTVKGIQLGEGDRLTPNMQTRDDIASEVSYGWSIRLDPRLSTGLDFLLDGDVDATFDMQLPFDIDANVRAELMIYGEETIELASISTEHSFTQNTVTTVSMSGNPSSAADRVPLGNGNMYLEIWVEGTAPPGMDYIPTLSEQALLYMEGAEIGLPLDDYHDEVDLDGLFLNAFNIAGNRTFSYMNAGDTLAFVFNVTNLLSEAQNIQWELTGANAEWGRVSPATTAVPGQGQGQVVVRVTAPNGALEGDAAELLLMGTSQEDSERQVFVRITALVSDEIEIPDESHVADAVESDVAEQNKALGKDSPGFEAMAIIAAVAAVGLMLRKKEE